MISQSWDPKTAQHFCIPISPNRHLWSLKKVRRIKIVFQDFGLSGNGANFFISHCFSIFYLNFQLNCHFVLEPILKLYHSYLQHYKKKEKQPVFAVNWFYIFRAYPPLPICRISNHNIDYTPSTSFWIFISFGISVIIIINFIKINSINGKKGENWPG